MRGVVLDQFGEPADVLAVRELPDLALPAGHVRVRMRLSPVNPSDLLMIRGTYGIRPPLPATPGFEGTGTVVASGGGWLARRLVGRRVALLNGATGTWREETVVPATQAVPVPRDLPDEQAAMFFVNPVTAYLLTEPVRRAGRGAWLLQSAAGSSLGRMVIRLGKQFGFRTINLVRRDSAAAELRALGADVVLNTSDGAWTDEVRRLVGKDGLRHAIDPVGGLLVAQMLSCLDAAGELQLFGMLDPTPISLGPRDLMSRGLTLRGFWLSDQLRRRGLLSKLSLIRSVTRLIRTGVLTSTVGRIVPLDQVRTAVTDSSDSAGKTLLQL